MFPCHRLLRLRNLSHLYCFEQYFNQLNNMLGAFFLSVSRPCAQWSEGVGEGENEEHIKKEGKIIMKKRRIKIFISFPQALVATASDR